MRLRALLLAGSAALIAVPASGASDFRLPGTSAPTPTPTAVGPVDPERPAPRPTPTPRPSPTPRPTLTPTPTPAPALTLPPAGQPAQARPTPRPTRTAAPLPGASPMAAPDAAVTAAPLPGETPFAAPTFAPAPSAAPAVQAADDGAQEDGGLPWPWIAGFGLLVALLAAGWWWLRRRMLPGGTVLIVPDIEKPRVAEPEHEALPEPEPEAAPEPALAAAPRAAHPLQIAIEPLKLTQSVMNASLSYKLSLTNGGEAPLEAVAVSADLVAAHASLPREALMAAPDTDLPVRHEVASIAPGETVELKGELRLPLARAMPIRQGPAVVFVPLARFRAGAAGVEPRCFTLVVGQPSPRGAIQPHRLDLGPRSAEGLTGHAF